MGVLLQAGGTTQELKAKASKVFTKCILEGSKGKQNKRREGAGMEGGFIFVPKDASASSKRVLEMPWCVSVVRIKERWVLMEGNHLLLGSPHCPPSSPNITTSFSTDLLCPDSQRSDSETQCQKNVLNILYLYFSF